MKRLIVSVLAAGTLAVGGAASAQDIVGNVLTQILGNVGLVDPGVAPAGSVYLDNQGRRIYVTPSGVNVALDSSNVYRDSDGRRFYVDASGRAIELTRYSRDSWGRGIYSSADGRVNIAADGGVVPYGSVLGAGSVSRGDRDGDGVPNRLDRYPRDPRYR